MTQDWARALLSPRSVALVGVSDDPAKTSGRPLRFLRQAGFAGDVFSVNPRRDSVQGEQAYKSLSDLPAVPEHVFIMTGAEAALDALDECRVLGVPVATLLSGGFADAGSHGLENDARLREIIVQGGLRVLGPSSIGIVNLHQKMPLTANAAFAEPGLPVGGVFLASHSGSLIGGLVSRGKQLGLGFAGLVSVGSESDLSIGEICLAALDDANVTSFMLFLESLRHADQLRRFAIEAARRGKPVAAYKLGRSREAAELAVSHTGALAGEDAVADAFLRACGIARVSCFDSLLEIMPLLGRMPGGPGRKCIGVVTTTGGGAAMAVDQLAMRGLSVEAPSEATRARLAEAEIDGGAGRIVDLTLAGTQYKTMRTTLDIMSSAPEFDLVLATVGSSARFNPELAVQPIIDSAAAAGTPLAAFIVPDAPEAVRLLQQAAIPVFRSPETCADAIAAAASQQAPIAYAGNVRSEAIGQPLVTLDEAEGYALLARHGVPAAPHTILTIGEPLPELPFAFPVAAKVLHRDLPHKSDVGGVVLGIADASALARAVADIIASVRKVRPDVDVRHVLLQPMMRGVGEVLIGMRRDADVGPVIMLAAGGIYTELYEDSTLRLAPVDKAEAMAMIGELKIGVTISGYRGRPKGDLDALADAIVAMSRLAESADTVVWEAEVNPMLVLAAGQGVVAVDALIRTGRK